MTDRMILGPGLEQVPLLLKETVIVNLHRADPVGGWKAPELMDVRDLIVTTGRTYLAKRISVGDTVASAMAYMMVGTGSAAPALTDGSTPGLYGEVKRKALAIGSTTGGANVWTAVSTFGGSSDSITSLSLQEAGIANHASSGQGTLFQRVTFASVVLANSDLLSIQLDTNVGSS